MAVVGVFVLALLAGAALPLQVGVNTELSRWLGSPVRASFVSFVVGAIVLGAIVAVAFRDWPPASRLPHIPWWAWLGGTLGGFYVLASIVTGPRLGAVAFIAIVVAGQAVASVLVDEFGWVGFAQREVTPGRIAGLVLVGAGVALVRLT